MNLHLFTRLHMRFMIANFLAIGTYTRGQLVQKWGYMTYAKQEFQLQQTWYIDFSGMS